MPSQEDIDRQRRRLEWHRATLAHCLQQLAISGSAYAQPAVAATIREARAGIATCKANLRDWCVAVEDLPDDDEVADGVLGHATQLPPRLTSTAMPVAFPTPLSAEYAPPLSDVIWGWAWCAFCAPLGIIWLAQGLGIALSLIAGNDVSGPVIVGSIALFIGVNSGWGAYRAMRRRVRVLPGRLEIIESRGPTICQWSDIETMWGITVTHPRSDSRPVAGRASAPVEPRYTSSGHRLGISDGRTLSIPAGLRGHQDLITTIKGQVQVRRLPLYRAQYRAQGEVVFGSGLSINNDGVRLGEQFIPWGRVAGAGSDDTTVWVQCDDEADRRRIPLSAQTPNPFVFAALVNEIAGTTASRGAPHGREP